MMRHGKEYYVSIKMLENILISYTYIVKNRLANFLRKANVPHLFSNGEESNIVASLLFADFPTGCLVEKISMDVVSDCINDYLIALCLSLMR